MDPESDLAARVKRGDVQAFGALVERYKERAYMVALGLVGNPDDAMDLSQEAFVRAFRGMRTFREGQEFYPWFYAILRNTCFNFLRSARVTRETSLETARESGFDVQDPRPDPAVAFERRETADIVLRELHRLEPVHREMLVLRHYECLSYREMAEVLGCPVGTVMSRLYAARQALRARLSPYLDRARDSRATVDRGRDAPSRARRGAGPEGGGE
jgi:RNA polymerase sigma-70 factor (ECF subfamily)